MTTVTDRSRGTTGGAKIAAALLALFALNEFRADALPALAATDLDGLWQASVHAAFALIVIIGLFQLKSWAWWLALFTFIGRLGQAVAGIVIFQHPEWSGQIDDPQGFMIRIAATGAVAILGVYLLAESGTRAAYRG